jgi:CheY-like chemotaxis protein/HPt (histidine-containing phosphotransfer) domain-containing protein
MLSSGHGPEHLARSKELGISSYLTKPVRRSALLSAITEAVLGFAIGQYEGASPSDKPAHSKSLRVLVAEDNVVNQKLTSAVLQRAGHIVTMVSNGRDAVAAIEREKFDAILMDVQMPIMGGFEATRLIREMEAASGTRTPIVAVTARAMKGDREACLEAGMDAFVPKPIEADRLLEVLQVLSSGERPEPAAQSAPEDPHRSEAVDEAALMSLVGGDRRLASQMAELYLDDLEPRVTEITAAVEERDPERLRAAAHALRGSSGTMRAKKVSAAAGALEEMARSRELDRFQAGLVVLNAALASLRPRLVALAGRG